MSTCCQASCGKDNNLRVIARSDFLFAAGAVAVIAGLLFPFSPRILDVLLIFSLSLTVAVLLITFSARSALQVLGLPLLIVLATMLRMALSTACSRLILSQDNADTFTGLLGAVLVDNKGLFAILAFAVLVIIIFAVICKTARGISRNAAGFITDIVPVKQTGIDNNLSAGVIDKGRARELRTKISRQAGFFAAMAGTARFILCAAVIELALVIVNVTASLAAEAVSPAATSSRHFTSDCEPRPLRAYTTLAVGAGLVSQMSALLAAVACGYFVRKSAVSDAADDEICEDEFTTRIKVVAKELTPAQTPELQYDDVAAGISGIEAVESRFVESNSADEKDVPELRLWQEVKNDKSYKAMAELLDGKGADTVKTLLTAAETVEELGVTIPVNIAVHLAKKGRRCLLIDLDFQRDAISKVFEVVAVPGQPVKTCVNNLWVWPAGNFAKNDKTDLRKVICGLESRYDRFIVYAPNINHSEHWDKIADCIQAAMLFGDVRKGGEFANSAMRGFHKLLVNRGCEILEPAEGFGNF
jgi:hypothetical protein